MRKSISKSREIYEYVTPVTRVFIECASSIDYRLHLLQRLDMLRALLFGREHRTRRDRDADVVLPPSHARIKLWDVDHRAPSVKIYEKHC